MKENIRSSKKTCVWALAFFFVTSVSSGAFIVYEKFFFTPVKFNEAYSMIDPSRELTPQEDFIVNLSSLRNDLREMSKEMGNDKVSIYVEFLNTGANISINPETYIWPASLAKVPLAMAVMKKVESEKWKLYNELVVMKEDRDDRDGGIGGGLSVLAVGSRVTIEKLLKEVLANSDNTAYNMLLRNTHSDELKEVIMEIGMEALFSEEGKVSAREYSRMFRSLYTSNYLKRENSQKILMWLDESTFDRFLAGPIGEGVPFPHKYGEHIQLNAYSDSGIVYIPNRPYIITVMVQGDEKGPYKEEEEKAAEFMRRVSEKAYEYFSGYGK